MVRKIISGGQSGSDQGALLAAQKLRVPTGGYAPKDYMTEEGPAPWLKEMGLIETKSSGYRHRTEYNVRLSDGTLLIGTRSAGTILTECIAVAYSKPLLKFYDVEPPELYVYTFWQWVDLHNIRVLNVAGNRNSVNPGIQGRVEKFLLEAWNSGGSI